MNRMSVKLLTNLQKKTVSYTFIINKDLEDSKKAKLEKIINFKLQKVFYWINIQIY